MWVKAGPWGERNAVFFCLPPLHSRIKGHIILGGWRMKDPTTPHSAPKPRGGRVAYRGTLHIGAPWLSSHTYLLWIVISVYVVTVGVASGTLYIYPMTLQDCCFFEKSKLIPELSAAGLPIRMKMKNQNPHKRGILFLVRTSKKYSELFFFQFKFSNKKKIILQAKFCQRNVAT